MSETYTGPSEDYYKEKAKKDKYSQYMCKTCENRTYRSGFMFCNFYSKRSTQEENEHLQEELDNRGGEIEGLKRENRLQKEVISNQDKTIGEFKKALQESHHLTQITKTAFRELEGLGIEVSVTSTPPSRITIKLGGSNV